MASSSYSRGDLVDQQEHARHREHPIGMHAEKKGRRAPDESPHDGDERNSPWERRIRGHQEPDRENGGRAWNSECGRFQVDVPFARAIAG